MNFELAARLCYLSYLPHDAAIEGFTRLGYAATPITAADDAEESYLLILDDAAIVVARGSDDAKDWLLRNAQVVPKLTDAGLVHSGFWAAGESIYGPVKTALDALEIGASRVTFLGHSKGGATAAVLAERFGGKAITIGAPRVFIRGYRTIGSHLRYVHSRDLVCRLPQKVLGYNHVGDCIVVDGGDWAKIERQPVVIPNGQLRWVTFDLSHHFSYGDLAQLWQSKPKN